MKKTILKKLVLLAAVLAMVLAVAGPAPAREEGPGQGKEVTTVDPPEPPPKRDPDPKGDPDPKVASGSTDKCEALSPTPEQCASPPTEETVTVTFELVIDGEVPPGHDLYVNGGRTDGLGEESRGILCSTDKDASSSGNPVCRDGGAYSKTFEVPEGKPFSYAYRDRDFTGRGPADKAFFTDQGTFAEDATVRATYTGAEPPGPPPSPDETVTFAFELAVDGEPPADAAFLGTTSGGDTRFASLSDPDGDGTYTGSATVYKYGPKFGPGGEPRPLPPGAQPVSLAVQLVQGTKTQGPGGVRTGEPISVIKDFEEVKADEDKTFRSSISFPDDDGSDGGGSGNGDETGGIRGLLPGTGGGMALMMLPAGALLAAGGLLLRRLFR